MKSSGWQKMSREERLEFRRNQGGSRAAQYWLSQYDAGKALPLSLLNDEEKAIVAPALEEKRRQQTMRRQQEEERRRKAKEVQDFKSLHTGNSLDDLNALLGTVEPHLASVLEELVAGEEARIAEKKRRHEEVAALKAEGKWFHPVYKTLKDAYAQGWRHLRRAGYGADEEMYLKGHHLIRGNTKRAMSRTEWAKQGYGIKPGEEPYQEIHGQHRTYGVYRDDQVEHVNADLIRLLEERWAAAHPGEPQPDDKDE